MFFRRNTKEEPRKQKLIGWLRHILTAISLVIFIIGTCLLAYMAWVLATSITITRFMSGTLIFTYSVVGIGFILFTTGLVGWVAGASELLCMLRLYLVTLIFAIIAQAGGIIALSILGMRMDDVLTHGWVEVNQKTRSMIQTNFNCCGFFGPKEFAYTNNEIDDSCYEDAEDLIGEITAQKLKQVGCGPHLKNWFTSNKAIWCSVLATIGGLQIMCLVLCIHIIQKLRDKRGYQRSISKRRLHNRNPAHYPM